MSARLALRATELQNQAHVFRPPALLKPKTQATEIRGMQFDCRIGTQYPALSSVKGQGPRGGRRVNKKNNHERVFAFALGPRGALLHGGRTSPELPLGFDPDSLHAATTRSFFFNHVFGRFDFFCSIFLITFLFLGVS
jgi:hypothetical protein